MEGLLAQWTSAIQEYDFTIAYWKGLENGNADALSRQNYSNPPNTVAATTQFPVLTDQLYHQQFDDPVISQINKALDDGHSSPPCNSKWRQYLLSQLWSQLCLHDGIACRKYTPSPSLTPVLVCLIPESYRSALLPEHHDSVSAAHLGINKTTARIRQVGYWVGMLNDIDKYCRECTVCQCTKPTLPTNAPLSNVPIGRSWEMVAVDTVEPVNPDPGKYGHL